MKTTMTIDGRWNGARLGSGFNDQASALYDSTTRDYCCLGICAIDTGVVSGPGLLVRLFNLSEAYDKVQTPIRPAWITKSRPLSEYLEVLDEVNVKLCGYYYRPREDIQFEQLLVHINDHSKMDMLDKARAIQALFHAFTPVEVELDIPSIQEARKKWLNGNKLGVGQ